MPPTFNENSTTDIACILDFSNKINKTSWLITFESSIHCSNEFLPKTIIDDEDIPCKIICSVGDYLKEPTENSIGVCSGGFCDMGLHKPLQITVLENNEFKGDPTDIEFDPIAPPPACATIFSVGKVVAQPKGTLKALPNGWRCFDIRSSYYDIDCATKSQAKKYFVVRWFIPDGRRWEAIKIPQCDSVVQLSGRLLGRVVVQDTKYSLLGCMVKSLSYISNMGSGSGVGSNRGDVVGKEVHSPSSWSARAQKRSGQISGNDVGGGSTTPTPNRKADSPIPAPATPSKKSKTSKHIIEPISDDDDELSEVDDEDL